MRELKPYRTMHRLRKAIDNGGRFYNFFTDADDDVVTRAELAKAAGVFSAGVNAFLFLEVAQQHTMGQSDSEECCGNLSLRIRRRSRTGFTLRRSSTRSCDAAPGIWTHTHDSVNNRFFTPVWRHAELSTRVIRIGGRNRLSVITALKKPPASCPAGDWFTLTSSHRGQCEETGDT